MKANLLLVTLFFVLFCTGLAPTSEHATFLVIGNDYDRVLGFQIDGGDRMQVKKSKKLVIAIEPGMHTIFPDFRSWPDTVHVAPCEAETIVYVPAW